MDVLPFILGSVAIIITLVLVVVGVQVFLVMKELRDTLSRVNTSLDVVEEKVSALASPFQGLGGVVGGVTAGMKVFEGFVNWLHREKEGKKG